MIGQHDRSESLFYYFRIEDQVPENHLLRFIDRYVSFDFVREKLRASYSETGRPSIDPEVLLRILLLGGISTASPVSGSCCILDTIPRRIAVILVAILAIQSS